MPESAQSVDEILERDKLNSERRAEGHRLHNDRFNLLRRMWEIWNRQLSEKDIADELTGKLRQRVTDDDLCHYWARRVVRLGRLLRVARLDDRLDDISGGPDDAKTIAVELLREGVTGNVAAISGVLQRASERLRIDTFYWLRDGLRYEVLQVNRQFVAPDGWEGQYGGLDTGEGFKDIESIADFAEWLRLQLCVLEQLNKPRTIQLDGRLVENTSDGRLVRNAYSLARKVGLPNISELPTGTVTVSGEFTTLENLLNLCRDFAGNMQQSARVTEGKVFDGVPLSRADDAATWGLFFFKQKNKRTKRRFLAAVKRGEIPAKKVGKLFRVPVSELPSNHPEFPKPAGEQ